MMKFRYKYLQIIFSILLIFLSSYQTRKVDYRSARFKNVCKDLKGDVLLYFIFIDSRATAPWTEFDIQSTIDSVRMAINWLHAEAINSKIPLSIVADFYIGQEYTTISRNLPEGSVLNSMTEPNGKKAKENLNRWADGVAKIAGKSMIVHQKDGIPEIKSPKNKERLVAFLRDENNVESVALFFFVNNYYRDDISIPVNIFDTEDVEFSIVSYKYASEIAHNLLHLFGAADLYKTVYRHSERKIQTLNSLYPDDVMQDPYGKPIRHLEIGEYTRYLIGWSGDHDISLEPLMTDKMIKF